MCTFQCYKIWLNRFRWCNYLYLNLTISSGKCPRRVYRALNSNTEWHGDWCLSGSSPKDLGRTRAGYSDGRRRRRLGFNQRRRGRRRRRAWGWNLTRSRSRRSRGWEQNRRSRSSLRRGLGRSYIWLLSWSRSGYRCCSCWTDLGCARCNFYCGLNTGLLTSRLILLVFDVLLKRV